MPSGLAAAIVSVQLPAVSSTGMLNVPSSPMSAVCGAGGSGVAAGFVPLPAVAGPLNAALTVTVLAFGRRALDRDRPVLERRALGRLVDGQGRREDLGERDRDEDLDRVLDVLAGVRVGRADAELVPAAAQLDVGRPGPARRRRRPDRLLAAGDRDRHERPGSDVPRRVYAVAVSSTVETRRRRVGDRDLGRAREPEQLEAEVADEQDDRDGQGRRDDEPEREREPLARRGDGPRDADRRLALGAAVAALAAPLEEDLVGVEPEVEGVVAQEALRVDRPGELAVVAALERAEVARPDLRVALGAVQVDALGLAGGQQPLGQGRLRTRPPAGVAAAGTASADRRLGGAPRLGWSCRGRRS